MLHEILHDLNFQAALLFCICAGAGQVLHFIKKWSDGEDWVLPSPRRTVGAIITNVGGMLVFIQTGVLAPIMELPHGTFALVLFGFMNGFTSDSAMNKGTKKIWTDEQREAEQEKQAQAAQVKP